MSVSPSIANLRRPFPTLVALALLVVPARADEPAAGAIVTSDPVFTAHLIDGTTASGRIRQFTPAGDVVLVPDAGPEQTVAFLNLLKLTRDGTPPAFAHGGSIVLLPQGDRLHQAVVGPATETTLEIQSYALGNVAIPLDSLLGLILTPPDDAEALDGLVARVRSEPRSSEVLWLANGDRLAGGFLGIDDKKIRFQAAAGPLALDRAGLVAIGFDPSLVVYPEPAGGFYELTLADGSRLGASKVRIEQGQVLATTRFGTPIRLTLNDLVRLHARSAKVAYLSERDAAAEQYVAYVGPTRPYRRNSSVDGHPLHLAGQSYDRGLGTQSRTLLAYRLAPGDRRFQATVGLDDGAGPLGSVVFRVLVDGRERFASPPMAARDIPKAIDVDVAGAKVLILVTEFGERGEVRDYADWAEARLIR